MAQQFKNAGTDVQAMFSNDIVGTGDAHDGSSSDPRTVRLFVEGVPTAETAAEATVRKSVGGVHVLSERRARSRGVRPEAGSARPALRGRVLTPAWRGPRTSVTGGMPRSQLRRVEEYVQANLAGDLRLTKLSTLVHMSPYHFARLFKQGAGVTPRQFVIRRRIEAAKILLTAQHRPIGDVALQVGFTSQSYFTTTFRRVTGVTPGHYRPQGAGSAESAHHVMKPPEKSA